MPTPLTALLEPLEPRITPALTLLNPLPDVVAPFGAIGAAIDLGTMFDPAGSLRTRVQITTNFDTDPGTPGIQGGTIVFELFDDSAPLTVANFLRYLNSTDPFDYTGSIFHRSVPGFILQGGGFGTEASPFQPIRAGYELHNEFDPDDSERSNTRGTIAMAKTSLGEHTATSQWFVNLGDNSDNLDTQNGGFTVFGRVVSGMEIVDAIVALQRVDVGGAFTEMPVLPNYDADPDNNPSTPPPIPSAGQIPTITGFAVMPAAGGTSAGVSFAVATTIVEGAPGAVRSSLSGDVLRLSYGIGGTGGVAKVTVTASMAGEPDVVEEFFVTVKPNLVGTMAAETLPGAIVPGDKGTVKFNVANTGAALARGIFDVRLYLSRSTDDPATQELEGDDPFGSVLDPTDDPLIGTLRGVPLNLKSGAFAQFTANVRIPAILTDQPGAEHRILVQLVPRGALANAEQFTDDNVIFDGLPHSLFNAFGSFDGRTNVKLSYTTPDGQLVRWSMTGPGFSTININANGGLDLESNAPALVVGGTPQKTASIVAKVSPGGRASIQNATFFQPVGLIDLAAIDLFGNFVADLGAGRITVGDIFGGSDNAEFIVGRASDTDPTRPIVTLGRVFDTTFISLLPLTSLKTGRWINGNATADFIDVAGLGSLHVGGSLDASVISRSTERVASITIAGALRNSLVGTGGDIGAFTARAVDNSLIRAGVTDFATFTDVPQTAAELGTHTIGSFTIKSAPGAEKLFRDSLVVAAKIGTISLQNASITGTAVSPFGFIAKSVTSYQRTGTLMTNLTAPGSYDVEADYALTIL